MLNLVTHGTETALPPLMIVHGLFGSARNWGAIARRMASDRLVLVPDMRNHGDSLRSPDHSYAALATDLAEVAASTGRPVDVVGHSMGGKAAMVLALGNGPCVNRLVVADIAPVGYGHSQLHLVEAMRKLDLAGIEARGEADRRLSASVADASVRAFLLQSLDLRATPARWRLNLDALGPEMDKIIGWPAVEGRYDGPALFLAGAESDYVRPEHRDRIRSLFPRARIARLAGAGHWLHADRPREFEAALRAFLT